MAISSETESKIPETDLDTKIDVDTDSESSEEVIVALNTDLIYVVSDTDSEF